MLLTRSSPFKIPRACCSAAFCHGQRGLSTPRRQSSHRRYSGADAVGPPEVEELGEHPRTRRTTTRAAEHEGAQAFLQDALAIDVAAALDLISRGSHSDSSRLRLADCQAWVAHLLQLAGSDAGAVRHILKKFPGLLSHRCSEQRLDLLQHHLQSTLGLAQPQQLLMVQRYPALLHAALDTVTEASCFLLAQLAGDIAALQKAVVSRPFLLGSSVGALQATLQWLTGPLGAPTSVALRVLPALAGHSIDSTLEPQRQWFLQHGFTPTQILGLVHAQPSVLNVDLKGQLAQLKLRYWQQQLGYSLHDLALVPSYLNSSVTRIASRHDALRHLQDATPTHSRLRDALISGSGSAPPHFGPGAYAAFVKQHSSGSNSVQDVLLPLSASLLQPALRAGWEAALTSQPRLAAASTSARKQGTLYAALYNIQQRDWAQSAAGRQCIADEAAAKAADASARRRAGAAQAVLKKARAPRKASTPRRGSPASAAGLPDETMPSGTAGTGSSAAEQARADCEAGL